MRRATLSCAIAACVALLWGCEKCAEEEPKDAGMILRHHEPRRDKAIRKERRPILPEAVVGEIEGDARVDRSRRTKRPRRRAEPEPDAGELPREGPASRGDELRIGDILTVGERGGVELRIPERGTFSVGNESWTIISPYGSNEIGLVRGRIHLTLDAPIRGRRAIKISTPAAHVIVRGTQALVGAADDGATRVHAVDGPAFVRTAGGTTEVGPGGVFEVAMDGRAEAPAPGPARDEGLASMDGWVQGRRVLARRDLGPVLARIAERIRASSDDAPDAFAKVAERRQKQRALLREMRERRRAGKRSSPENTKAQQQLASSGQLLVEGTDEARALWWRVFGASELLRILMDLREDGGPGAQVPDVGELRQRVRELQEEATRLLRRSPRRPRPAVRGLQRRVPEITPRPARVTDRPEVVPVGEGPSEGERTAEDRQ